WFNGLADRNDYEIWGIEADGKPVGACGLKNITEKDCEYWGYIGEKSYWGHGIGSIVLSMLIEKARKKGLQSIWLKVLKTNSRAIKLYEKYGFSKVGNVDDKQIKMELIL
ncbi:MAG: GNAT family N-acetyltransferase, partial [bacterium]